ncbi:hypothetical protein F5884DRAFT_675419 [Xylogone sp. PMI_703]|nr:hypothetical protein F5884DRAFT_675419 [Xylogone sp. PMI_703]
MPAPAALALGLQLQQQHQPPPDRHDDNHEGNDALQQQQQHQRISSDNTAGTHYYYSANSTVQALAPYTYYDGLSVGPGIGLAGDSNGGDGGDGDEEVDVSVPMSMSMSRAQAFGLYTSHFLSTWNARGYEFAAIIFTAAAYPDTLTAVSIRGIVRTLSSILLSSTVGRAIDRAPNRLKTLLTTITVNRASVICASVFWFFIVQQNKYDESLPLFNNDSGLPPLVKGLFFSFILVMGILEALSGNANMLSMERDWVVAVAAPDGQVYDLTHLNSAMRRIDLVCKLVAPILISTIISMTSVKIGVLVVGGMSAASWSIEILCAKRVWDTNPRLRIPKAVDHDLSDQDTSRSIGSINRGFMGAISQVLEAYLRDFKNYFSSIVWIPSIALAFLYISALSYSAIFITYLLNVGISLDIITIARAAGSLIEISSTVVTPVGVHYLAKARHHHRRHHRGANNEEASASLMGHTLAGQSESEGSTETGLERLGLWGLSWQLANLAPVVCLLWSMAPEPNGQSFISSVFISQSSQTFSIISLFFFLSLSRLGLWVYDLTTQQLTQTMTPPSQRSSFTGVEQSFSALFELTQNIVAIILHRPEDFMLIAAGSWLAVLISTLAYAGWVWKMRGHLVHWEKIGKGCECVVKRRHDNSGQGWE